MFMAGALRGIRPKFEEAVVARVHLHSVSFSYESPVLESVELALWPGWWGLVGANGAGKTTLLRLIGAELAPDSGQVEVRPHGARIRICPQVVESCTPAIWDLAAAQSGDARRIQGRLKLDPRDLDRWPTLSPGERKRWQIGAALADMPDVLLLDEPTNHLDGEARGLLMSALSRFRGVGVVVSHDRALLNGLTEETIRLEARGLRAWSGAYDPARAQWRGEEAAQREARERLQGEEKRARRVLDEKRRARAGAERELTNRNVQRDRKDRAARCQREFARIQAAENRFGRQVRVARRTLERAEEATRQCGVTKALGRSVFVNWSPARSPVLASLHTGAVRAGERTLLRDVDLRVDRSSRVHIAGANGAGKTTLLRALLDASLVPSHRCLYIPQELSRTSACEALAELRQLPPGPRSRVLNLLAALGVPPARLLASRLPSPGEARKLMLALGLVQHAWLVVLDEPTNHLDLPSVERLEEMLDAYPGALILVAHDHAFAERATHTTWALEDGRVQSYSREPVVA